MDYIICKIICFLLILILTFCYVCFFLILIYVIDSNTKKAIDYWPITFNHLPLFYTLKGYHIIPYISYHFYTYI